MKKVFINYATPDYYSHQSFALFFAKHLGGFDECIGYRPSDIDQDFFDRNKVILDEPKGAGLWLWKVYFIYKTLMSMENGDLLFYADTASFMVRNINLVTEEILPYGQDVMAFGLPFIEKQWTSEVLFHSMDCKEPSFRDTNQVNGSFHLIKKSIKSLEFYKEYLFYATDFENISGGLLPSKYEGFIEHRYDQSIFSLLYKKRSLTVFKDPSQFGLHPEGYVGNQRIELKCEQDDLRMHGNILYKYSVYKQNYGMILYHWRQGNPLVQLIKFFLKLVFSRIGIYKGKVS